MFFECNLIYKKYHMFKIEKKSTLFFIKLKFSQVFLEARYLQESSQKHIIILTFFECTQIYKKYHMFKIL